ncbi:DUF3299 domain-containing protein [Alkalimarinus alittae]|uniref:DUF3299 domain-containing protein n=1 Tax=Alkalimarinus alittae TaxID=2961619 RepID=A0ABY6N074_9ALTE|nr:DUF3299 domain-containing protein [Alkalimarinus alittae]UZE95488.1 DUF3299 domain-containing protein [Alkalimarinus alittae]
MDTKKPSVANRFYRSLLLTLFIIPLSSAYADSVKTLEWDDLIPDHVIAALKKSAAIEIDHSGDAFEQQMSPLLNAVKKELDGQKVRLPGFMVPLGGDENKVTEFLLVPYFGACMHTPPPPTNQIVYVNFPMGVHPDMLYDPVWIEGPIKVGEVESDLAVSGYSMKAIKVSIYTEGE